MSDTLTDADLLAMGAQLIQPFRADRVRGASYDVSAGDALIIAYSLKQGGRRCVSLRVAKSQELLPGLMAILFSFETFTIPIDIQARISLRSDFATRGLFFAGGLIDPGFKDRVLWLPIANLSTKALPIRYDQPMFRVEFTQLSRPVSRAHVSAKQEISEEDMPALPEESVYDITELSRRLESVEAKARLFEPSTIIVQLFLLAAIAGVVAGAVFGGIQAIGDGRAAVAAGIGVGIVAVPCLILLALRFFRR